MNDEICNEFVAVSSEFDAHAYEPAMREYDETRRILRIYREASA